MAADDALQPCEREDLAGLVFSWGTQYDITYTPPSSWRAVRCSDPEEVHEATTAAGLRAKIRQHYWPAGVRKPG